MTGFSHSFQYIPAIVRMRVHHDLTSRLQSKVGEVKSEDTSEECSATRMMKIDHDITMSIACASHDYSYDWKEAELESKGSR